MRGVIVGVFSMVIALAAACPAVAQQVGDEGQAPPADLPSGRTRSGSNSSLANYTAEACRSAAWAEAARLGASAIEVDPVAHTRKDRSGRTISTIQMRVTYAHPFSLEVKEGRVTCTVDKSGQVISSSE